jgi:hypothetical protein
MARADIPLMMSEADARALQRAISEAFRPIREQIDALRENILGMGTALEEMRKLVERWEVAVGSDQEEPASGAVPVVDVTPDPMLSCIQR